MIHAGLQVTSYKIWRDDGGRRWTKEGGRQKLPYGVRMWNWLVGGVMTPPYGRKNNGQWIIDNE